MTAEPVHQEAPPRQPMTFRAPFGRRSPSGSRHDWDPEVELPPRHTVLVVAEEADLLCSIHDLLRYPCRAWEASEPAAELELISVRLVHIILADRRRRAMTGIEFLTRVRARQAKTVQLLLTAPAEVKDVIHAIKSGQVYRYHSKPWDPIDAPAAACRPETIQAFDTTAAGWWRPLQLRDPETDGHSRRVSESGVRLAREMGMDESQLVHVRRGALLHDIGKVGIPDQILGKPGPLTDEERSIMKCHASYGYELLAPIAYLREALAIPHCHHERWDGTGYPRGLKGEEIPLAARVFAIIDVWDALCSDRPYRKAWSKPQALAYIHSLSGAQFDPRVVDRFLGMAL